jgi:hypothetical protein
MSSLYLRPVVADGLHIIKSVVYSTVVYATLATIYSHDPLYLTLRQEHIKRGRQGKILD